MYIHIRMYFHTCICSLYVHKCILFYLFNDGFIIGCVVIAWLGMVHVDHHLYNAVAKNKI